MVDDESTLSELMSMGLRMAGSSVAVAAEGPEAVKLAKDFRPNVLVLDVMLPGFDGAKSLARMQSQSERMTASVEDLLLLARLDEGQPLKLSEVDLS
ncbi:DNA-binding response OmpR family regulator [Arthrobacter sp. V1I9]|nr:DNA-binding response OmpR family regulator [Arthrobacter sp. V1I9]